MTLLIRATMGALLALACLCKAWAIDAGTLEKLLPLAQQSNPEAQYHVGMLHNNGIGGAPKDAQKAFAWFLMSAHGGDPLGAYKAGCYFAGQFGTVAIDKEQALHWKLLAAKAGYSLAQYDVAGMFAKAMDREQARHWWKLAADQGFAQAAFNLAIAQSKEPNADKVQAYTYLKIAGLLEPRMLNPSIQAFRDNLVAQLTAQQMSQAEVVVSAWKPQPTHLSQQAREGAARIDALLEKPRSE